MCNRCERISGRYQIDNNSTGTDDKSNRADSEVKVAAIALGRRPALTSLVPSRKFPAGHVRTRLGVNAPRARALIVT